LRIALPLNLKSKIENPKRRPERKSCPEQRRMGRTDAQSSIA
jgi:hypothetical protein